MPYDVRDVLHAGLKRSSKGPSGLFSDKFRARALFSRLTLLTRCVWVRPKQPARVGNNTDRNRPCKSRWLGYFVDREVGAIW